VSVTGLYRPPVFRITGPAVSKPPHTIISDPVQTAVCPPLAWGTFAPEPVVSDDAAQVSVTGSYRPPVLKAAAPQTPPQTIISEPVQMAVW